MYYYVSDLIDGHVDFDQWHFCVVWAARILFFHRLVSFRDCSQSNCDQVPGLVVVGSPTLTGFVLAGTKDNKLLKLVVWNHLGYGVHAI